MIDWNKVIEQALGQAPAILGGAALIIAALRPKLNKMEKNQDRIEAKADGNHARALEAVRDTSRENVDQLIKAVEKVLAAQSPRRGEKRSTDPDPDQAPTAKRGRRSTDKKESDT